MADNFIRRRDKRDIGCFYIRRTKPAKDFQTREWPDKKIPLHFLLIFLIFWGALVLLSPDFFSERKWERLGLASLVDPIRNRVSNGVDFPDIDFKNEININAEIEPEPAKLPLSNNKFYLLPLVSKIEIQETPAEKPKEVKKAVVKRVQVNYSRPTVLAVTQFNAEELKNGKYIEVSISEQTMRVWGAGELKGAYKISTGKNSTPTPVGNFRVLRKSANAWSVRAGLWMPYAIEFTPGVFIHELPYWPGGKREGETHLGQRVSGGCVRLGIGPAQEVYEFADIGTPVIIRK